MENEKVLFSDCINLYLKNQNNKKFKLISFINLNQFNKFLEFFNPFINYTELNKVKIENNLINLFKLICERIILEYNILLEIKVSENEFISQDLIYSSVINGEALEFISKWLKINYGEIEIRDTNIPLIVDGLESFGLIESVCIKLNEVISKEIGCMFYPIDWTWNNEMPKLTIVADNINGEFSNFLTSINFNKNLNEFIF